MIFAKNHRFLYIFCLFFNVGQNQISTNDTEPTSAKVAFLSITAKTSITILTSTITSLYSIFQ